MAEPTIGPQCLYVVWDENFALKGAAFYRQTVYRDAEGKIAHITSGDAEPVAILGQLGIDVSPIMNKIGQDALVLAETKAAELEIVKADLTGATAKCAEYKSLAENLQARVDELTAAAAVTNAPVMRVPTAALLIVMRKRGLQEQFDAVVESLEAEQQEYLKALMQMPYTRRDHALVEMLRQAFAYTPAEVDQLFAEADAI